MRDAGLGDRKRRRAKDGEIQFRFMRTRLSAMHRQDKLLKDTSKPQRVATLTAREKGSVCVQEAVTITSDLPSLLASVCELGKRTLQYGAKRSGGIVNKTTRV
jgi:hypothetical protein